MTGRPLTARQKVALQIAAFYGVTSSIEGSMPSLARRGLVERPWIKDHGRRIAEWRVTDAGRAEAERLRAERYKTGDPQ